MYAEASARDTRTHRCSRCQISAPALWSSVKGVCSSLLVLAALVDIRLGSMATWLAGAHVLGRSAFRNGPHCRNTVEDSCGPAQGKMCQTTKKRIRAYVLAPSYPTFSASRYAGYTSRVCQFSVGLLTFSLQRQRGQSISSCMRSNWRRTSANPLESRRTKASAVECKFGAQGRCLSPSLVGDCAVVVEGTPLRGCSIKEYCKLRSTGGDFHAVGASLLER